MAKCKSCLHLDVCNGLYFNLDQVVERDCRYYKRRSDYVEVVHGQMEEIEPYTIEVDTKCGLCGISMTHADNYCPNCGADMRERGTEK